MAGADEGTVLVVNSHRAGHRLESALRRKPAYYYDTQMRRGGKFVVLYGNDVAKALEVPSVGRTRLKVTDVALCWSDSARARRVADMYDGASKVTPA